MTCPEGQTEDHHLHLISDIHGTERLPLTPFLVPSWCLHPYKLQQTWYLVCFVWQAREARQHVVGLVSPFQGWLFLEDQAPSRPVHGILGSTSKDRQTSPTSPGCRNLDWHTTPPFWSHHWRPLRCSCQGIWLPSLQPNQGDWSSKSPWLLIAPSLLLPPQRRWRCRPRRWEAVLSISLHQSIPTDAFPQSSKGWVQIEVEQGAASHHQPRSQSRPSVCLCKAPKVVDFCGTHKWPSVEERTCPCSWNLSPEKIVEVWPKERFLQVLLRILRSKRLSWYQQWNHSTEIEQQKPPWSWEPWCRPHLSSSAHDQMVPHSFRTPPSEPSDGVLSQLASWWRRVWMGWTPPFGQSCEPSSLAPQPGLCLTPWMLPFLEAKSSPPPQLLQSKMPSLFLLHLDRWSWSGGSLLQVLREQRPSWASPKREPRFLPDQHHHSAVESSLLQELERIEADAACHHPSCPPRDLLHNF